MENLRLNHAKGWSTHQTMLIKAILVSKGDVLELGGGLFSTPLLHWLCKSLDRKLTTCENDKDFFFLVVKNFQSRQHRVCLISDWNKELDTKKHYGVVFVDHHPNKRRYFDILRFKDTADYIVIHDTDPEGLRHRRYDFEKVWDSFKYVYHWKACRPWSSVVSNTIDVTKWNDNICQFLV